MNSEKLIYRIAEKGLTFTDVADMIDIDRFALYRKLAGFEEITSKEVEKLTKALDLSDSEISEILLDRSDLL